MRLLILETDSIVEAYKSLDELSKEGHTPLEFSPNAHGARLIFKAASAQGITARAGLHECDVSESVVKAYLSLSDSKLLSKMLVIESNQLPALFQLVQNLETLGAKVLEVRSFKSNPKINYAIVTFDNDSEVSSEIKKFKHVILDSNSSVLKDFLAFNN